MLLVHLQCHFGLDTLDLVRLHPTARGIGVDFSEKAITEATKLATALGLDSRTRFVHANVYDAGNEIGEKADVVYTGKGALNWLPHLDRWAGLCFDLLRPGGWLYLCEFHPVGLALGEDEPVPVYDYFDLDAMFDETPGTYADPGAPTVNDGSYEWNHPLSDVINALINAGFRLRFLHEWDYTLYRRGEWLVRHDDGSYRWAGSGKLPLMYSLKARKPAPGG
jgi:SAM-dependent methyltransferase